MMNIKVVWLINTYNFYFGHFFIWKILVSHTYINVVSHIYINVVLHKYIKIVSQTYIDVVSHTYINVILQTHTITQIS
jgi:hypothetical protein